MLVLMWFLGSLAKASMASRPERFPEVSQPQLLQVARAWLRTLAADRVAFYTAEGEAARTSSELVG